MECGNGVVEAPVLDVKGSRVTRWETNNSVVGCWAGPLVPIRHHWLFYHGGVRENAQSGGLHVQIGRLDHLPATTMAAMMAAPIQQIRREKAAALRHYQCAKVALLAAGIGRWYTPGTTFVKSDSPAVSVWSTDSDTTTATLFAGGSSAATDSTGEKQEVEIKGKAAEHCCNRAGGEKMESRKVYPESTEYSVRSTSSSLTISAPGQTTGPNDLIGAVLGCGKDRKPRPEGEPSTMQRSISHNTPRSHSSPGKQAVLGWCAWQGYGTGTRPPLKHGELGVGQLLTKINYNDIREGEKRNTQ
ncbi:uncharacterized protein CIMG_13168 [Coccidioides immitis RS]|uniref:Uncharacterized protein n=1 Tax=Coccidioides immitis (strain RS) TaxID=246410 RepID=J3K652_COCIM|nr:uncharacterized protein CIMG_13168 [Coccidioides immitis RS]EAS30013.3 hypothetical protein CIMG_13168 [Coccidioides immitis RS]